jgi:hypothetical protein
VVKDALVTQVVFEKATELFPLTQVDCESPGGTCVIVLVQKGGEIAAYGKIASFQPNSLGNIHVKVPSRSWLVIDIDTVLIPSAAAILHLSTSQSHSKHSTKPEALTLAQLQAASSSPTLQAVRPVSLLDYDC